MELKFGDRIRHELSCEEFIVLDKALYVSQGRIVIIYKSTDPNNTVLRVRDHEDFEGFEIVNK